MIYLPFSLVTRFVGYFASILFVHVFPCIEDTLHALSRCTTRSVLSYLLIR